MVAEGPGREDRHDDADDIDARFEEIVAGLRAEQAASQQRRREAIRRAQSQQRGQKPTPNRPLEGFDNPNPWPPRPSVPPGTNPPVTGPPGDRGAGSTPPGVNPPVGDAPPGSPRDVRDSSPGLPSSRSTSPDESLPPAAPSHRGGDARGRHRARPHDVESDYPDSPGGSDYPGPPHGTDYPDPTTRDYSDSPSGTWRGWDGPDEEEHFIPPTPPLPAGDLHLWAIVVGLLGGPLILILSNIFTLLTASWWTPVGILVSVAGVVLLVLRLPKNRDDTDFTGGAQV